MMEFIIYDSPCLCMGTPTIMVNGKVYRFKHAMMNEGNICKDDLEVNLEENLELEPYKEKIIKLLNMDAVFKK